MIIPSKAVIYALSSTLLLRHFYTGCQADAWNSAFRRSLQACFIAARAWVLPSIVRPLHLPANAPAKLPSRGTNCLGSLGRVRRALPTLNCPSKASTFSVNWKNREKSQGPRYRTIIGKKWNNLILLPSYRLHRLEEISDDRNAGLGRIGGRRDSHRLLP